MSIINDIIKIHRILENTNLDEYELIDFPLEQLGDSSQEHTGVESACTFRAGICEGSSVELCWELTLAMMGLHCLPLYMYN